MEKRIIEKIGAKVSLLGFGCMRFPSESNKIDAEIDMAKVYEMIDRAYLSGVNYYDTAYVYGDGKSEMAIGKALSKYPRESYYLADKLPIWAVKKQDDFEKIFNTSLKRLGTDYIDFYLLHSMDKDHWDSVKNLKALEFCRKKKAEGKIRNIGFSFHDTPEVFKDIVDAFGWDFVQIQLNYYDWQAQRAKQLYKIIEEKGLSCIVMEPIRGGGLANPPKEICDVFAKNGQNSPSSWALRFCASLPRVKVILSGMSDISQVNDNLKTLSEFKPLSDAEYKTIDKVIELINSKPNIKCTGCRYCMPCPRGVDIPGCFEAYNEYIKLENKEALKWTLGTDLRGKGSEQCVKCGACIKKCPQHLKIPDELLKLEEIKAGF